MDLYFLWLSKIFTNYNKFYDFIKLYNVKELFNSTTLSELNITNELKEKLISSKLKDEAKRDYEYCINNNIKLLSFNAKEYPINLTNIPSPPPLLYYKGTLLPQDECSISIVGSRKYTEYGNIATKKLAYELSSCNITIISGMARGIDGFAHKYAINANGRTIAVLGTGINVIYPTEHSKLYNEIIENGAVISEFPLNTAALPKNFPIRNRIVAGLSLGTLVIEAAQKSGSMITARLAGEFGRNVYAIPGNIFNSQSVGTNELIKDGAKIVTCTEDILIDIYSELNQIVPKPKQLTLFTPTNLSEMESKIYSELSLEPVLIDSICKKLNIPLTKILETLTILELQGYVKQLPGQKYIITT